MFGRLTCVLFSAGQSLFNSEITVNISDRSGEYTFNNGLKRACRRELWFNNVFKHIFSRKKGLTDRSQNNSCF